MNAVWVIATDLLRDIAFALIAYGLIAVLGAVFAGPSRVAVATRRWLAPTFRDRPVVTLCPYIVGDLDGAATIAQLSEVAENHTGVLVPRPGGYGLLRPA